MTPKFCPHCGRSAAHLLLNTAAWTARLDNADKDDSDLPLDEHQCSGCGAMSFTPLREPSEA